MLPDFNARLASDVVEFRNYLRKLGLCVPARSALEKQLVVVESYLQERSRKVLVPTSEAELEEWLHAMSAVIRLTGSVVELSGKYIPGIKDRLRTIMAHDLSQDFVPNHGKDTLYEFETAAWLHKLGFAVDFGEPDVRASAGGLSEQLGFACKYPSSAKRIQDKFTEGMDQLKRHGLPGFTALGLDQLEFTGLQHELLSAESAPFAAAAADSAIRKWIEHSVRERSRLASLIPLDGALFTLDLLVVLEDEHGLAFLRRVGIQTATGVHPLATDLALIAARTSQLPR